jgi:hypothetical protein
LFVICCFVICFFLFFFLWSLVSVSIFVGVAAKYTVYRTATTSSDNIIESEWGRSGNRVAVTKYYWDSAATRRLPTDKYLNPVHEAANISSCGARRVAHACCAASSIRSIPGEAAKGDQAAEAATADVSGFVNGIQVLIGGQPSCGGTIPVVFSNGNPITAASSFTFNDVITGSGGCSVDGVLSSDTNEDTNAY